MLLLIIYIVGFAISLFIAGIFVEADFGFLWIMLCSIWPLILICSIFLLICLIPFWLGIKTRKYFSKGE